MQFSIETSRVIRDYAHHFDIDVREYSGNGRYSGSCLSFVGRLGNIFSFYEMLHNSYLLTEEDLMEIHSMFTNWQIDVSGIDQHIYFPGYSLSSEE